MEKWIKQWFMLLIFALPSQAFAENVKCEALLLKLDSDQPIPGPITSMIMTDQSISLITESKTNTIYQIDHAASKESERTYIAKLGNLPINQTPADQQISVMMTKSEVKENCSEGILTDTALNTYVLKNCKIHSEHETVVSALQ